MPIISEKVREDVRLASDIVDVIGSYLPLKKAGGSHLALCPFHKEKTPSFHVNPQRQMFKCFGCGEGGDVFSFVMKYENVDFMTALRMLAEKAGIALPTAERDRDTGAQAQKDLLYRLHDEVCSFFQNQLARDDKAGIAREYLKKRGVSPEMVKLFRIGFAPDSWDATLQWAYSRKYKAETLEVAGLATRRNEGSGHYDRFRGRLMFPICNEQGRVVGFSGRVLDADAKEAKYVNSPETPIFQKGRILFGLDKTKRAILEAKHAVICEGQLDMIACYQAGVQHVVAPQGTAFTDAHGRILKRYVDEVVLCFDSDAAGQNAAVRSIDSLIGAELIVRVAELPTGHDPDSLIQAKGVAEFQRVLQAARSYFDFHLDWLSRQHDPNTDAGKVAMSRAMAELLGKVPNVTLRATYLQRAARTLGVSEDVLREEMRRSRTPDRTARSTSTGPARQDTFITPIPAVERMLLELMIEDKEVVARCAQELDLSGLGQNLAAGYIREIVALHKRNAWTDPRCLAEGERTAEQMRYISGILLAEHPPRETKQLAGDCLRELRKLSIQAQIDALKKKLSQSGMSFEEMTAIQKEIHALDMQKRLPHIPALPTP